MYWRNFSRDAADRTIWSKDSFCQKAPCRPKGGANLTRGKGFPGMENRTKRILVKWSDNDVNMIWHHDEFIQSVTIIIVMPQRIFDNSAKRWLPKDARSITSIQPVLQSSRKAFPVVSPLRLRMRFWVFF
jgi:hypothetical protein